MLVKLGNIWVDPSKVEGVYTDSDGENTSIDTGTRSYHACKEDKVDEFAIIINSAGQSFGGEDEKPKET